jgi:hypothetical protein
MGMFLILLIATFLMLFVAYLSIRRWKLDVAKYCAGTSNSTEKMGYAAIVCHPFSHTDFSLYK